MYVFKTSIAAAAAAALTIDINENNNFVLSNKTTKQKNTYRYTYKTCIK
jgi:hypothetical protein